VFFVFSLVAALLIAVLVAILFTVVCVGVSLLIVLPTIFVTTMGATFLFLWGLGGYYILKWFNSTSPAKPGKAIGDKLSTITGGRLDFLMQNVRNPSQPPTRVEDEKGTDGEKEGLIDSTVGVEPADVATKNVDTSKATNVANDFQTKETGDTGSVTEAAERGQSNVERRDRQ